MPRRPRRADPHPTAQAHQRGQHNEIYFPLSAPVRKWTLPKKVWELAFSKKRILARHDSESSALT